MRAAFRSKNFRRFPRRFASGRLLPWERRGSPSVPLPRSRTHKYSASCGAGTSLAELGQAEPDWPDFFEPLDKLWERNAPRGSSRALQTLGAMLAPLENCIYS